MNETAVEEVIETKVGMGSLPTKVCPQCGQRLFADMDVCYGCLYDFRRSSAQRRLLPDALDDVPLDEPGEPQIEEEPSRGGVPSHTGRTTATMLDPGVRGLLVQTSDVDVVVTLPERGIVVGRQPTSDVVLHSKAVSKRHLRIIPTAEGALATDLGATNAVLLHGRELHDEASLRIGDTLDVCGALLTLVEGDGS